MKKQIETTPSAFSGMRSARHSEAQLQPLSLCHRLQLEPDPGGCEKGLFLRSWRYGGSAVETATADKGYYRVPELQALQAEGIKTVISDPIDNRRVDKLPPEEQAAVRSAKRTVKKKRGKDLLARRGMHIERAFAHLLDAGGARRTTLRGQENLNKRYKFAAAIYNLSQLMRKLFGFGTPKQLAAFGRALFSAFFAHLLCLESYWSRTAQLLRSDRISYYSLGNSR